LEDVKRAFILAAWSARGVKSLQKTPIRADGRFSGQS
jgi:hypothetical protein